MLLFTSHRHASSHHFQSTPPLISPRSLFSAATIVDGGSSTPPLQSLWQLHLSFSPDLTLGHRSRDGPTQCRLLTHNFILSFYSPVFKQLMNAFNLIVTPPGTKTLNRRVNPNYKFRNPKYVYVYLCGCGLMNKADGCWRGVTSERAASSALSVVV